MSDSKFRKITFSLPSNVVDDLDALSSVLGCSRSAVAGQVLAEFLTPLVELSSCLPNRTSDHSEVIRRARGVSGDLLGAEIKRLVAGGQDDLFRG